MKELKINPSINALILTITLLCSSLLYAQKSVIDTVLNDSIVLNTKQPSKLKQLYSKYLFKKKSNPTVVKVAPFQKNTLGKPIRTIHIKSQDPFGYSLQDTTKRPKKWLERTGNTLHGKTKNFVIREILLFKKGDHLDSTKIKESERLLRSQRILRRVEILPILSENGDSVDVFINSIDSWSMITTGSITTSRAGIRIRERNFLGLGHVFDNRYRHNYETGKSLYQFNYTVPNIAKTRIIGNVNYFKNENEHYNKSVSLVRPFYSPLAKYAGGIGVGQVFYQDSLDYNRTNMEYHNFKYNFTDIWGARAFRLGKSKSGKISNFILSGRYYDRNFKESPTFTADPYEFFSDQKNYFLGVGVSARKYTKDSFIYNYGIEEYVAEGHTAGIIAAIQDRPGYERFYLAGTASFGKYLPNKNYFGVEVNYGSFFRNGNPEQTTFNFQGLYFSHLLNWGRWNFRQFSKVNYTVGSNRWNTPADEMTLHQYDFMGMDGIRGARNIIGTQKLMLEFQTQSYSPYEFLGFRISPFFNASLGVVGNKNREFFHEDNIIARVGLGVMFTNDYFVFNNFHLSFSFYPRIPGEGTNVIKTNVIDNRDFNLMDYSFDKPSYIRWNRWD